MALLPGQLLVDVLDLVEEATEAVAVSVTRLVRSAFAAGEESAAPRLIVVGPGPPVTIPVRPAARRV